MAFIAHKQVRQYMHIYQCSPSNATSAFESNRNIAHALGAINGVTHTNSMEAFAQSYSSGMRLLEADLAFTSDHQLVCFHEGSEPDMGLQRPVFNMTRKEFTALKLLGSYTPCTAEDLPGLLRRHKDAYIVVDTKGNFNAMIESLDASFRNDDRKLMDRIIPEIFSASGYDAAMSTHCFPEMILSLYRARLSNEEIASFVQNRRNIRAIALPKQRLDDKLVAISAALGLKLIVHTVNDPNQMQQLRERGVYGFYTDGHAR